MLPLLEDTALALWALSSILLVGVAGLKIFRAPFTGLELLGFGAGLGVLIHGLAGLAIALSPAKQATARVLFLVIWGVAALGLWRQRSDGRGLRGSFHGWRETGVGPTLAILSLFIVFCVGLTHLQIRFPRVLPDGAYVFKEHTLPVKLQVLTGTLPGDNYIPFVVQEYLLRDISFAREHPIAPGQEVSNRTILMALATAPFRAALKSPPRRVKPLDRFTYVRTQWPDVSVFMEGDGFRRFLAVGIVLNALVLLGAALVISAHGPRALLVPGLLLLATSPFYLSQTIFTWPKCLAAFFLLLALHALARGKSPIWVAAAGALAYHSHPYAAVFLLGFGCHYAAMALWRRGRSELKQLVYYGVTAGLALAPWFVWTRFILGLPSDLVAQNFAGHGMQSLPAHLWVRFMNLYDALAPGMLSVSLFPVETMFYHTLICLPGILGLLALPAYAGCALCLRSHRVFVFYGVLLPAVLLSLPFSGRGAPLTLLAFHSIGVCLLLLGLIVIARAGRAVAVTLIAAQIFLQLGLLFTYGRALGATFSSKGVFYRLLDHRPEVRDARHEVNFRVDIGIGDDHAEAIWSEPSTVIVYRQVRLPPGVTHFRCRIAIHPHVWAEGNADGAEFALEIRSNDGGAATAASRRVWSAEVDPFHHSEQRAWLPVDVDLSEFAGKTVDLILKNGAGPANNDYADWCLWADPELVQLAAPGSR
jgi:hypothetical protein